MKSSISKLQQVTIKMMGKFRWTNQGSTIFPKECRRTVNDEDLQKFISAREELFECRKEQEGIRESLPFRRELRDKMVHLLCQGGDKFTGDTYPILVINKPAEHMDRQYLKDNLSFLSDIPWKAVFDFDSEANVCNFLREEKSHVVRVIKDTDSFHERSTVNLQEQREISQISRVFDQFSAAALDIFEWVQGYGPRSEGSVWLETDSARRFQRCCTLFW